MGRVRNTEIREISSQVYILTQDYEIWTNSVTLFKGSKFHPVKLYRDCDFGVSDCPGIVAVIQDGKKKNPVYGIPSQFLRHVNKLDLIFEE